MSSSVRLHLRSPRRAAALGCVAALFVGAAPAAADGTDSRGPSGEKNAACEQYAKRTTGGSDSLGPSGQTSAGSAQYSRVVCGEHPVGGADVLPLLAVGMVALAAGAGIRAGTSRSRD